MVSHSKTKINWQIFEFDSLDSTNDEAFRLYQRKGNDCLPNLIISKSQNSGRGQFDRSWQSPEGNVYCSFSLSKSFLEWRLGKRIEQAQITLKIGEIVHKMIYILITNHYQSIDEKKLKSILIKLTIKKPNDILFDGKKLAGILVEVKEDLVVVGIGINSNVAPGIKTENSSNLESISLKEILNKETDSKNLILDLSERLKEIF